MENKKSEILGGITTFMTMSYIVIVNPTILQASGMPFSGALTSTVLAAFLGTLLMGLYGKLPYALAPGMGLNAFFTYGLVLGEKIPWQTALGIVFLSGLVFLILSVTPFRSKMVEAIPGHLRTAMSVGIGLFLTFIGLKNMGMVIDHPATLVAPGPFTLGLFFSLLGLVVCSFLLKKESSFAFLACIVLVSLLSFAFGVSKLPDSFFSAPDFKSTLFQMDLMGALKWSFIPPMLTFMFTDLLDTLSTFIGVSQACNLTDEKGQPKNLNRGLIVDAIATAASGVLGTSPTTTYIESSSGIRVGGRTGFTAIVCALCFLPCLFISPVAAAIPGIATAPILVLVGSFMFKGVADLPFDKPEKIIPAFLTIVLIPLNFSITQGIVWGLISHNILYFVSGRRRELSPMMILLGVLCCGVLALHV